MSRKISETVSGRGCLRHGGLVPFLLLVLAACATAVGTPYQPADSGGYGFSEIRIEADRYRIAFAGDGATPPDVVESLALRRAAELGQAAGYDWFRVISSGLDRADRGGVNVGAGLGTGSFGRRGGVSAGVGGDLGRIGSRAFYTSRLEVLMGRGEAPDEPDIYSVEDVLASTAFAAGLVAGE